MRNWWEGEVELGMLIAARMALARQLGIFRNYHNPTGLLVHLQRRPLRFTNLRFTSNFLNE